MKKLFLTLFLFCLITVVNAQKNSNGVIYDKHPAIDMAENFLQAWTKGDAEALTKLTTDDFKAYNSMNTNWDYKGQDLKTCIQNSQNWAKNFINLSIKKRGTSYPDALEFKKDGLMVNSFNIIHGINKNSGFKVESPYDCTFIFNADGTKIKTMMFSMSTAMLENNVESEQTIANGTIYKNHPYIVKVRKFISNSSLGKVNEMYADFAPNARFYDINYDYGTSTSVEERKKQNSSFLENFEIEGIDENGYPDMFDYEGSTEVVEGWWKMRLKNKKTNKRFTIAIGFSFNFNQQGQIQREISYYNGSQLSSSFNVETKK